ncbi:ESF1 -like protein ABT1-associated protein [Collichthys lucidus]|uniref:ESF1-like protein ABT1-associated protein n=1 Tax=Collichthys lucidus TaxID=240159 RepID=A0A4U5U3S3_COLLU|nr:ESF1 -like protein ABT1-associated protein [Collichthys lucidus]
MSSKKNQEGDDRFLRVQRDPRFWEMPEKERKIKIDKRFQSMFHDKRFKVKYTVDKRGRPINHTSTEDLKRFYKVSDSEDEEDEEDVKSRKEAEGKKKKKVKEKLVKADGETKKGKAAQSRDGKAEVEQPERGVRVIEEDDEEQQSAEDEDADLGDSVTDGSEEDEDDEEGEDDDDDDNAEEESDVASGSDEEESGQDSEEDSESEPDLARGKGNIETSSDEDDEDDVDIILKNEEEEIEHDWGELCKDAPRSDEISARLAVCNMDWDRLKAKDLLALLNSFVPKGGAVLSVKVYPSEFGKERVYREKMRDYQFKRLKYFYAVVECDSVDTAAKVYEECDGYEYESSCSMLDLRFIPDDVKFDEEPRDVATDVNLSAYTPKLFTSSATTTSKVELTWDETDHDRVTALNRKFNKEELLDMDFNAYLASSSEEEEEDDEDGGFMFGEEENGDSTAGAKQTEEPIVEVEKKPQKEEEKKKKKSKAQISKYRELLKGIQSKEKKLQEDKNMEMEITWVPGLKETTEQLVKKKLEGKDKLTPWEEFLEKKKDKKKQKKSQRKQASGDKLTLFSPQSIGENEDELSEDELPSDVDLSDPFFAEEIAATDTKKKQKGKKKTKQEEEERTAEDEEKLEKQKAEMALLMEDDGDEAKRKHFNYDKIVEQQNLSKKKKKKLLKKGEESLEDDFQVDVKDPRFQAMFTSHLFNLDPSHPSYKKTKATQSILTEKQRRREEEQRRVEDALCAQQVSPSQGEAAASKQEAAGKKRENDFDTQTAETTSKKSMDPSLSLLVKSIKSKTEQFQARKKQKFM